MKVLLSWMQEFAPGIDGDPAELAAQLTDLGLVVESVDETGPAWDGIIVAKILELAPHPDADRIQVVQVDTGGTGALDGTAYVAGEPLQICCGAFNMSVGDLVPLATLGTTMPNGMEIAQRPMRGQMSNGMLCSAEEIGLGTDADGIWILDPSLPLGAPLADALGSPSDIVFDIDVEGNRPDALSVAGVARDLAARLGVPFAFPAYDVVESGAPASERASVTIESNELCARFAARVLDDITVGTSPQWMQDRLTAAGMRPISSIVDISNYVMLEQGVPNHTYDLALVPDGALSTRMGRDGERITTLDGQDRPVTSADGVITNAADEPIGLAGVMGGASTEISDSTTSVVVEAAVWDRMTIAWTSRRLDLRSEASTRFERGADPMAVERALDRFCQLAQELCGATVAPGTIVTEGGYSLTGPVRVRTERVNMILNLSMATTDWVPLVEAIGFECTDVDDTGANVQIPSWRPDATGEIDVIEEIGRHHGYSKSGKRVPVPEQTGSLTPDQLGRRRVRRAFMAAGLAEAMPMAFLAPGDLAAAGLPDEGIVLSNPLVAEESVLRTSMLPGLLKSVAYNQSHRATRIALFELGAVYLPGEWSEETPLPDQPEQVCAIVAGSDATDAVRLLHRIAADLGLDLQIVNDEIAGLHPTRAASVIFRGRPMGQVGEVSPAVLDAFGVAGRVAWLQLDVAPMLAGLGSVPKMQPVSTYPSSDFDLAFVVPDDVPVNDVVRSLKRAGGNRLRSVDLFDVYPPNPADRTDGRRSLAFRLRFQADDRTLDDEALGKLRDACIELVTKRHKGELRG